jgi:hypothetical protein
MIPARSPTPAPVSLAKLLLVEGDTPMHFFEALLRHLHLGAAIEVRNFRGVGDFKAFVTALAATAEFQALVTSVGVVRDAEDRPAVHARQSVEAALAAAGLTPARTPPVRTSVFILPDDTNPGMIETLCMEAVRGEPSLAATYGCITDFFTCLARNGVALPPAPVLAKNHAEAYLATRPEPQLFPGLAAYRGYWPWSSPAFQPLIRFLQAL